MSEPVGPWEWREHSNESKPLIRSERLLRMVAVIAGLHLAGLSYALGPRCIAYIGAAYLSAVVVWGSVLMGEGKRRVGVIVGVGLSLAVQQAAYQVWKPELAGFWWPLAQFFAIQLLIGAGVARVISYRHWGLNE